MESRQGSAQPRGDLGRQGRVGKTGGSSYSMLFMAVMAASASLSFVYRTKPKPRLRPVSRSFTTTCSDPREESRVRRVFSRDAVDGGVGYDALALRGETAAWPLT